MLKVVAALALAGALAAGVFLAPVRGRTIADRWNAASGPGAFASNAWDETRRAWTGDARRDVPAPSPLRDDQPSRTRTAQRAGAPARSSSRAPARPMPVENHSAEDRAALDRLLSERTH